MASSVQLGIDDLSIPRTIIGRILKTIPSGQINMQREARDAFVKSATVFISYISAQAADFARKHNRKTIVASDVYDALAASEFESFVASVTQDTTAFQLHAREKRSQQSKASRAVKKALSNHEVRQLDQLDPQQQEEQLQQQHEVGDEEENALKRQRIVESE